MFLMISRSDDMTAGIDGEGLVKVEGLADVLRRDHLLGGTEMLQFPIAQHQGFVGITMQERKVVQHD